MKFSQIGILGQFYRAWNSTFTKSMFYGHKGASSGEDKEQIGNWEKLKKKNQGAFRNQWNSKLLSKFIEFVQHLQNERPDGVRVETEVTGTVVCSPAQSKRLVPIFAHDSATSDVPMPTVSKAPTSDRPYKVLYQSSTTTGAFPQSSGGLLVNLSRMTLQSSQSCKSEGARYNKFDTRHVASWPHALQSSDFTSNHQSVGD